MSKSDERKIPALVLGNGLTVLGVLRCLGRKGIPAYCVSEGLGFERTSRWCRTVGSGLGAFATVSDLERVMEDLPADRAVVFACSDHWTMEATRIPAVLKDRLCTSLPEADVFRRFVDKVGFAELLASTAVARSEQDVMKIEERSRRELFLKPASSQRFHQ